MSSIDALVNNFYTKCTVLVASLNSIVASAATPMTFPGTASVVSTWVAPQAGCLYALSGHQKSASTGQTLTVAAAINGTPTSFATPALAFNGSDQKFSLISTSPITFQQGDELTIVATPSGLIALGMTCTASLMVLIGGQ